MKRPKYNFYQQRDNYGRLITLFTLTDNEGNAIATNLTREKLDEYLNSED